MKMKNKKLLTEIMNQVKASGSGDDKFNALLAERLRMLIERASIDKLMDATAEIARFQLEDSSSGPIEYNLKSIPILDTFMDEQREMLLKTENLGFTAAVWFGAFLGKVLVEEFNGQWLSVPDSEWDSNYLFGKVRFDNNLIANPTVRLMKSIEGGNDSSVAEYVQSLSVLVQLPNPTENDQTKKK